MWFTRQSGMVISSARGCGSRVRDAWLSVGPEAVIHRAERHGYQQGQRLWFTGQRGMATSRARGCRSQDREIWLSAGPGAVIHRAERYGYYPGQMMRLTGLFSEEKRYNFAVQPFTSLPQ